MGLNELLQVGNVIRKYRKSKGITQKEMASLCGIPYSTYSNYENNNREPSLEQLEKIASVLNVDVSEFLFFNAPEQDTYEHVYYDKNSRELKTITIQKRNVEEANDVLQRYVDLITADPDLEELKNIELIAQRVEYIHLYNKLNAIGKEEAVKRVQELTEIPRYTQKEDN